MKSKIYLIAALCLHLWGNNDAQTLEWARNMGAYASDFGYGISVDDNGNVYSTGTYFGHVNFDPNNPGSVLDSFGRDEIFIQKYDALGNFLWAKGMGGKAEDYGQSIKTDHDGNVYTTGYFQYSVDFDPGPGEFYLTGPDSSYQEDIFIQKLDTDGNFIWARSIGFSGGREAGYALALDESRNVYVAGGFSGTVDFDPGPDEFNLTSEGEQDAFILKLNTDGNFLWAKRIGGVDRAVFLSLVVDSSTGNILLGGYIVGMVDLDPGPETFISGSGIYDAHASIVNLDSNGNFIWGKTLISNFQAVVHGIDMDQLGNIYLTGTYKDSVDLDPGPGTYYPPRDNNVNNDEAFVLKLGPDGNFIWAASLVGKYDDAGWSIAVDDAGNVYTTGTFGDYFNQTSVIDFDPGPGVYNLTSNSMDIFIQKLDTDGNFVWAYNIGSPFSGYYEEGNGIFLDQYANIFIVGDYHGGDFDPGPEVFNMPASETDIFILKWSQCGPDSSVINVSACDSYALNGQTYTQPGTYSQVQADGLGCYTKITLNLTIESVDASVTQEATTLTANTVDAGYQWVDCDQNFEPIPGETGQSFTAMASGNYAVVVTQNGCPTISDCYAVTVVGTEERPVEANWLVYPNPTDGKLTIAVPEGVTDGIALEIRSVLGQLVQQETASNAAVLSLNLDLPAGVYIATIRSGERKKAVRLVVN